jgi:hypothetical protein
LFNCWFGYLLLLVFLTNKTEISYSAILRLNSCSRGEKRTHSTAHARAGVQVSGHCLWGTSTPTLMLILQLVP